MMGDMADYCIDMAIEEMIRDEIDFRFYAKKGIWLTKDGKAIKISEMSDEHLANTEKMLRRNRKISQWPAITKEIKKRGIE
jgi:hypothetical protein